MMRMHKKHALALVDGRISESARAALLAYADSIALLPPHPSLPVPVSAHADMLLWCYDKTVFCFVDYLYIAAEAFDALRALGYEIHPISEAAGGEYPYDVPLNCALVGSRIIANPRSVSRDILGLAEERSLSIVPTRQGYSKCSVCVVSEDAIVTADRSIAASAAAAGIDVLLIREGGVRLDGYGTGFIGGATGYDGERVYFCGSLDLCADADAIRGFCKKHGKTPVSLTQDELYDVGTILFFDPR